MSSTNGSSESGSSAAEILTVHEIAQLLRVPKSTVYKMARMNQIPASKIGKHWRFVRSEIHRWLRAQSGTIPAAVPERRQLFTDGR
jgi:excisionase family DNA binding protein